MTPWFQIGNKSTIERNQMRLSKRQGDKSIEENIEIKKINDEKKAPMAAQFAAESTLRRVHAAQKDEDMPNELKTPGRELARANITANIVASVVANEWKDGNDKGEMQQLLALSKTTPRNLKYS
ncbi:unnamed protein product [Cochlearia groenlandica]